MASFCVLAIFTLAVKKYPYVCEKNLKATFFRTSNRSFRSFHQRKPLFLYHLWDPALLIFRAQFIPKWLAVLPGEMFSVMKYTVISSIEMIRRDIAMWSEVQNLDVLDEYDCLYSREIVFTRTALKKEVSAILDVSIRGECFLLNRCA